MLHTRPTTLARLLALVRYAGAHDYAAFHFQEGEEGDTEEESAMNLPILRAVERAVRGLMHPKADRGQRCPPRPTRPARLCSSGEGFAFIRRGY
jgi:hypothetical protein